jgi:hypothetical protein
MLLAVWIITQEAPAGTADLLKTLGPFSAAVLIGGMWVRDLTTRLREAEKRERLRDDKMLELAERALPALANASKVNEDAARLYTQVLDELRRIQARREAGS